MSFYYALKLLSIFFHTRELNILQKSFMENNLQIFEQAKKNYYYYHFPFLIHIPFIIFISPYFWYLLVFKNLTIDKFIFLYIIPFVLYFLYIFFIISFDKLQFYSIPPSLKNKNPYFGLFGSIIVTANLIFFLLHPVVAWIFLLISIFYNFFITIYYWSRYHHKRILKVFSEGLILLSFFLILLILFLFINNIIQSIKTLKQFQLI